MRNRADVGLGGPPRRPAVAERVVWCLAAALLAASNGCAGYQIGHGSLYRPGIRTVHVPVFQSNSFRRNLGERLTEAVVKEIESRTPYKVVHRPDADSVLSGSIISETKQVLAVDGNSIPRNVETDLIVEVNWFDRGGGPLLENTRFDFAPLAFDVAQNANFIPEGGQSVATAHQESIQRLARQIVSQMESRW